MCDDPKCTEPSKQPLTGVRVLELGMFHAGPGASAILGDLGAEVIKIEQPGAGDPLRRLKAVGSVSLTAKDRYSIWHEASNRSKKSITVDLRKERGREVAYRLVSRSDVFLTSLRRPAVENLKMDYPVLSGINPRLIYAWVSGYGPKGPDRDVGAFDYQGQGRSGMMFCVGEPDMPPLLSQLAVIDQTTSIMASHAILTALLARERFGIGQEVHVSLLGTALYMLYCNILINLVTGVEVPRHKRAREYPLRNYYRCSDGLWFILTANEFEKQWPALCRAIGHPELEQDERCSSEERLRDNSEYLVALFDSIFATKPRHEWLKILAEWDLPVAPVNKISDLADDPQVVENGYIVEFKHPRLGNIKIPGYPVHFSKTQVGTRSAAPELGEHTESVLMEIGGYSPEEIDQLRCEGVI